MAETATAKAPNEQRPPPLLVAVDFSEDSREALVWASRQAEQTGSPLVILHVVHDPAASPGFYRRPGEDWLRPMVEVAEQMMAEFLADMKQSHPELKALAAAETKMVSGLPPGRIVETAEAVGAALIVVGSCGRTGLPYIMLGSVAQRVAQTARVPVVIVKRREQAGEA